ncbi:MAG: GxxExxY protein [Verrucomicrobiota bacterium]|nr:GxxExxY protein [Verrucomicrobiota bacterium]
MGGYDSNAIIEQAKKQGMKAVIGFFETLPMLAADSVLGQSFEVIFRNKVISRYNADLVVEKKVIVELKCYEGLAREHQAQLFNYLRVSRLPIGLLVNFRYRKLEYQRLHQPEINEAIESLPF